MEEEKIKVPVYEGMAKILEVVNASYLCKMMGVDVSWINKRQNNKLNTRGYRYSYLPKDVDMLNQMLPRLAGVLLRECLIPLEMYGDSNAISMHLRTSVKPIITLSKLVENRLGKTIVWMRSRLDVQKSERRRTSQFKPEDAEMFNQEFKEIILYLRGIELEYEPPK